MNTLQNLPYNNDQLRNALESLNEQLHSSKNVESSHYLLQWVVNNIKDHESLLQMCAYIQRQCDS